MTPDASNRMVQSSSAATGATNTPPLPDYSTTSPTIPDYQLLKRIGGGGYGDVWLVRSLVGTYRAAKVVYRRSFEHDQPFEREFKGIQRFEPISHSHESQVKILHVGRNDDGGYFYYIMELADDAGAERKNGILESWNGAQTQAPQSSIIPSIQDPSSYTPRTLKHDLQRRGRLPVDECVHIGLALTTALAHLHQHGLIHRDIKPSNIIFVNGLPKLADIGLVTDLEATRSFVGTEGFIPPEGPGSVQADVFSLGKVLYEMSVGRSRFDFPALPANWDELPAEEQARLLEFNEVLVKACESDPRRRYRSAQEMAADLALLQGCRSVKHRRAVQHRLAFAKKVALAAVVLAVLLAALPLVKSLKRNKPPTPEVARLYQLGRWHFGKLTEEGHRQALEYMNQVVKIDPNFAPAYETLFQIYFMGTVATDVKQKEREVARKLMKIDDTLAASHTALSWVRYLDRDYEEAEREIKRAIQLDPNYSLAHASYSYYLSLWGRVEQAIEQNRIAVRIEPASRMLVTHAGYPYLTARQYDKAIAEFRNALVLDQNYRYARDWIAHVYEDTGRITEAVNESEKADILSGGDLEKVKEKHDALRRAYADGGVKGYWLKKREQGPPTEPPEDVSCDMAAFHAHLGEKAEALDWLEKAYAEGTCTDWLLMDPCWQGLRDEPRFHTLLKKMRLEK